jgi:hypothetical protein
MELASCHFSGVWKVFRPLVYRIESEVLTLVAVKKSVCVVRWIRAEVRWATILTIRRHLPWLVLWHAAMKFPYVCQGLNCNWLAFADTYFGLMREKIMPPADNLE